MLWVLIRSASVIKNMLLLIRSVSLKKKISQNYHLIFPLNKSSVNKSLGISYLDPCYTIFLWKACPSIQGKYSKNLYNGWLDGDNENV